MIVNCMSRFISPTFLLFMSTILDVLYSNRASQILFKIAIEENPYEFLLHLESTGIRRKERAADGHALRFHANCT
jgi:hypothetical protein